MSWFTGIYERLPCKATLPTASGDLISNSPASLCSQIGTGFTDEDLMKLHDSFKVGVLFHSHLPSALLLQTEPSRCAPPASLDIPALRQHHFQEDNHQ